jgi:hypothetical protein
MILSRRTSLPVVVLALSMGGCPSGKSDGDKAVPVEASQEGAAPPAMSVARKPPPTVPPPRVPPPCRIASAVGSIKSWTIPSASSPPPSLEDRSGAVVAGSSVPDDVWFEVGKDSHLTTRDATSTRETTLIGPGRFHACIGHREEAWVQSGTFESVGGAGERPGGEEWVATPLGAARYDVAKWSFTVKERSVEVRVTSGTGYFWPAEGVKTTYFSDAGVAPTLNDQGWVRLEGLTGASLKVDKSVLSPEAAGAALDTCAKAAAEARSIAENIAETDGSIAGVPRSHMVPGARPRRRGGLEDTGSRRGRGGPTALRLARLAAGGPPEGRPGGKTPPIPS